MRNLMMRFRIGFVIAFFHLTACYTQLDQETGLNIPYKQASDDQAVAERNIYATNEAISQSSAVPLASTILRSDVLSLEYWRNHPAGRLVPVPTNHVLSLEGSLDYDQVYLFVPENDPTNTWEVYGVSDSEEFELARLTYCDKDYEEGTSGNLKWVKCSGTGNECHFVVGDDTVIIVRC